MEICQQEITDRSAWQGAQLVDDRSWEHHLRPSDIDDIEASLESVNKAGLSLSNIGASDFAVPSLAPVLATIGQEIRDGRGFAMLRGLPVERYELDDLEKIYWGLCSHLGIGMTQNSDASLIHYVTDGTLRPNQGGRGVGSPRRSSLHVDLTDAASLLCVRQAPDNPASWVASSVQVHNDLLSKNPAALARLYEGFEWDRLDEEGPSETPTTGYKVPVFSAAADNGSPKISCRYNRYWMAQALKRTADRLPDDVWQLFNLFDETADANHLAIQFEPGDIQFINNFTVLHGRDAHAEVPQEEHKRLLMRIWLDFDVPRPVADDALVRLGVGRHGSLGWTVDQFNAGEHLGAHPRSADGRPLTGVAL
ncbi:MAG: hypothetical protein ACI8TP_001471 [Acidimicrobiales bacterium]|jgi:hypothetical protein